MRFVTPGAEKFFCFFYLILSPASGTIPITLSKPANNFSFVTDPQIQALLAEVKGQDTRLAVENIPRDTPSVASSDGAGMIQPLRPRLDGDVTGQMPDSLYTAPGFTGESHGIRLYRADAFDLLRQFPAESFDLIFADPPYFLSSNGMTCQAGKRVSVNKGDWDKPTSFETMHEFNKTWLSLCRKLLKPNGTLWVTGTLHNIYSVGYALQTLGYKILNDIAWYKVNPPPNLACRYFTHATETVLWARKEGSARHYFDYSTMKRENGNKQMQSLWHIKPPLPFEKRYGKHPTQKPEALLERIVRASSRPGDTVLDPFCGSGTTGVVCARLGRSFVGVEQEAEYLALAVRRLQDEMASVPPPPTPPAMPLPVVTQPGQRSRLQPQWAEIVAEALQQLGGEADLREINRIIEQNPNLRQTRTWPCTVRRVIRECPRFESVGKGHYRLLISEAPGNQMVLKFQGYSVI